ncbi:DNA polymerase delta subunit 4-like [Oryza brachyantha]|uniref:DNA polymerase delta subunit 4 n=1 Tax=Oryza brachyantha TaxID=4533 RepID=J3MQN5_ORYBR|nr:DNA polymerase delta subunit 4-like [Oryza brachyantha]
MRSGSGGGDMKSFFRQQKAHAAAGSVKPTGGVSKKASQPRHHQKPVAQAVPDLADDPRRRIDEEEEERERMGREFDMDMRYGPCLGVTRAQRWRRAAALGLAPPHAVIAVCSDDQPCLWEGRV